MRICLSFLVLCLAAASSAEDLNPDQLKNDFVGRVVALREPLRGSEIIFHPDGKAVPPVLHGTFGRDALFRIEGLKVEGSNLEMQARRSVLLSLDPSERLQVVSTEEKAKILLVLPSMNVEDVNRLLGRVFRQSADVKQTVANYAYGLSRDGVLEPGHPVVSNCRLQPTARPAPRYPPNGRMVARVIVNELGEPDAIAVQSSPKSRNDTRDLVITLWNWRFAPVRRNGRLVSCNAAVGIRFTRVLR